MEENVVLDGKGSLDLVQSAAVLGECCITLITQKICSHEFR